MGVDGDCNSEHEEELLSISSLKLSSDMHFAEFLGHPLLKEFRIDDDCRFTKACVVLFNAATIEKNNIHRKASIVAAVVKIYRFLLKVGYID